MVSRDKEELPNTTLQNAESVRPARVHAEALSFAENIIDSVPQPLLVLDSRHCIKFANRAFYESFQARSSDIISCHVNDLFEGQWNTPQFKSLLNEIVSHNSTFNDYEIDHEFPKIGRRVMLLNVRRVYDNMGDPSDVTLLAFEDITERNQTELAIRESEAFSRGIFESSPDCVKILDTGGCLLGMNKNGQCSMEIDDFSSLKGRTWHELWPTERKPEILAALESARLKGTGRFTGFCPTAKGTPKWWDVIVAPVHSAEGEILRFVSVSRDISEQREMANELRQLAAHLSEADRRKNEFLAMLAHELRNPLAPILNALQIMQLSKGDDDVIEGASKLMQRQVSLIVRLVDDLLDVSRITRGKLELRKERVEIASVIEQAIETTGPSIESAKHKLNVVLPPVPIYLDADPVRLAQAFGNLLNNASKYTEPEGNITLVVEPDGFNVLVSVKDNGVGLSAEMLPKIFDLFTQVDFSLDRSQGGLGIGLTLVKLLVEMHDGLVSASSEGLGRGSEFTIRLPISNRDADSPVKTIALKPVQVSARILVVDDNVDAAMMLAKLFEISGNETLVVHDGQKAVEEADRFRPDVVLLDIGLPRLNGFEAAQQIRRQTWGKNMVLVALTGWGQEEDRIKTRDAGFDAHLIKPVEHAVLMQLLAELLPDHISKQSSANDS